MTPGWKRVNCVQHGQEFVDTAATDVLLVEDDPTLRSTLTFNLTRQGYRVRTASNGEEALGIVAVHAATIGAVILDVMLPGQNGFQVLREIRKSHDTPVLMLSARGEEQDKVDGLELGADDYLAKPFAMRELFARLRAIARRRRSPASRPPSVLYRGNLHIEPDRRRAKVQGTELQLRPKEFGLLMCLALEPERVFERQELLDTVWGRDVVVDQRTVDVHISWLRSKLTDAGMDERCIRTVYGAGYRFTVQSNDETFSCQHGAEVIIDSST